MPRRVLDAEERDFLKNPQGDTVRVSHTKDGLVQLKCGDKTLHFTPGGAHSLVMRLTRQACLIQLDEATAAIELECQMLEAERLEILTECEPMGHA